jgi:hypothetical protein
MNDHTAAGTGLAENERALNCDDPIAETLLNGFRWVSVAGDLIETKANRRAWVTLRFQYDLRDLR